MTDHNTSDITPDELELHDYNALISALGHTLDLHGGLAAALDLAAYSALRTHITKAIDIPAGLRAALDTFSEGEETDQPTDTPHNSTDNPDAEFVGEPQKPTDVASLAHITQRDTPRLPQGPTVGLVTAIPEEFVAMRALLDNTSEAFMSSDPAHYVLGTLPSRDKGQRHGVALMLLGATATNAAANGCANLIRSFPSITIVIMVGIAAGVPNPQRPDRHVRLGDVVIATQIVDFDHIRAGYGGVEPRRPLSLPSPRLTHCADILRTEELSGRRPWERWLNLSRHPGLAGYGRPPEHTDVLYDSAGWPLRHPRRDYSGHRKGFPKVHHGIIGSSNRSLRDVTMRDQLATQHGLIALEMEGAGIGTSSVLHSREWFVIRGISDYGDSYRSDQWRRYAALAAAAYTRELLATYPPTATIVPNPLDHRVGQHGLPELL
jgi:nucleoside phosphorylase